MHYLFTIGARRLPLIILEHHTCFKPLPNAISVENVQTLSLCANVIFPKVNQTYSTSKVPRLFELSEFSCLEFFFQNGNLHIVGFLRNTTVLLEQGNGGHACYKSDYDQNENLVFIIKFRQYFLTNKVQLLLLILTEVLISGTKLGLLAKRVKCDGVQPFSAIVRTDFVANDLVDRIEKKVLTASCHTKSSMFVEDIKRLPF